MPEGDKWRAFRNMGVKNKKAVKTHVCTACLFFSHRISGGGDEGIRTLDTSFGPYAPLAGECLRPLGHISGLLSIFNCSGIHDNSFSSAPGQWTSLCFLHFHMGVRTEFPVFFLFSCFQAHSCFFGRFLWRVLFCMTGFELFVADAELVSAIPHHFTQFPNAHVADFLHADEQGCSDWQTAMTDFADDGRGDFKCT